MFSISIIIIILIIISIIITYIIYLNYFIIKVRNMRIQELEEIIVKKDNEITELRNINNINDKSYLYLYNTYESIIKDFTILKNNYNKKNEEMNNIIINNIKLINVLRNARISQRNKINELILIISELKSNSYNSSLCCSICLENVYQHKYKTKCNHIFHKDCLDKWDKNTCPNCRANL